ncbi:hypothetical protein, partial [Vibrio vulnificus]|uniref:hypothetical protein n=1 Tax=Vibrio vulnificus TaxID=672 RepID=UPI0039B6B501
IAGATAYIYKAHPSYAIISFFGYFNTYQPLRLRRYKQYLLLQIAYLLRLNKLHILLNSLVIRKELIL